VCPAGNFSVFGAGIDKFVQEQQQNAALEALGKGKKLIGKTAGGVVGGITTAGARQLIFWLRIVYDIAVYYIVCCAYGCCGGGFIRARS
jgi:hypothetical protein